MEPMQRTNSHVCEVCKGSRAWGHSLCGLCWPGLVPGVHEPTLVVVPVLLPGPMEKNTRRHSRGPPPAPTLGTGCIKQQSKNTLERSRKVKKINSKKQFKATE